MWKLLPCGLGDTWGGYSGMRWDEDGVGWTGVGGVSWKIMECDRDCNKE